MKLGNFKSQSLYKGRGRNFHKSLSLGESLGVGREIFQSPRAYVETELEIFPSPKAHIEGERSGFFQVLEPI